MKTKIQHWIEDYAHALRHHARSLLARKEPSHYLDYIEEGKPPIVLIPGIYEKWHFLQGIADPLSLQGYPIYVVRSLERNTREIREGAERVHRFLVEHNLSNVITIAHSKGGLIAKYLLLRWGSEERIRKVIAIATPFVGSTVVSMLPLPALRELHSKSAIIQELGREREVNRHILSIYGHFDNHVWPTSSCVLEGAKNVQVDAHGHHAILSDPAVLKLVFEEVKNTKFP